MDTKCQPSSVAAVHSLLRGGKKQVSWLVRTVRGGVVMAVDYMEEGYQGETDTRSRGQTEAGR